MYGRLCKLLYRKCMVCICVLVPSRGRLKFEADSHWPVRYLWFDQCMTMVKWRIQTGQNSLIETLHSSASSNKRINPAKYGTSHNQLPPALNFKQHYITVHKLFFSGKAGSRKYCIIPLSLSQSIVKKKPLHWSPLRN